MIDGRPLLTLEHEDGTAGVVREPDGACWLTGYLEDGGGTGIDETGRGEIEGLTEDRTVQGGLLPAGAAGVEVVDPAGARRQAVTGGGAWLVVLEGDLDEPAAVRFAGEHGETVRPPLPDGWARDPVPDATEPCPACGATVWEEVTPLDESRGVSGTGGELWPTKFVACAACGHEISGGVWITATADDEMPDAERERLTAQWLAARRREQLDVLRTGGMPAVALHGWAGARAVGGWSGSTGRVTSITVTHEDPADPGRSARVTLDRDAFGDLQVARDGLTNLIETAQAPLDRSQAALSVWFAHAERQAACAAHHAQPEPFALALDDTTYRAVLIEHDGVIAVAATTPIGQISVQARGLTRDELALTTLENPAEDLAETGGPSR